MDFTAHFLFRQNSVMHTKSNNELVICQSFIWFVNEIKQIYKT